MKRKALPILIIIIIAVIVLFTTISKSETLIGEVETSIIPHTAEVNGKIIEMPIELGQKVNKGDLIAIIDHSEQAYTLTQLEISLEKAKLNLSDTEINTENSNNHSENTISIAVANYNNAKATADKAKHDYEQAITLYQEGAIPKNELDTKKLASESASYAEAIAKGQLDNSQNQVSASNIALDIKQLESKILQAKDQLKKYTLLAQQEGIIMSKNYAEGDMVSPGYNLAEIAPQNEKYLVFYIPKDQINKVSYHQKISFQYQKKAYLGTIQYIDVKSEYTPKDLQTEANKNRESIKIKILISKDCPMKPGEQAKILLP